MNKQIIAITYLLSCAIALVAGHSWLNIPEPRGYAGNSGSSASTSGPCGQGTAGVYTTTTTFPYNGEIQAQWTRGGGHGEGSNNVCRFSIISFASGDTTASNFDNSVVANNVPCPTAGSYTHTVSLAGYTAGTYLLQFRWQPGDGGSPWYNCAKFEISNPGTSDCTNNIKDGPEGDVDCGSLCPNKCATKKTCGSNLDCVSSLCVDGICQQAVKEASEVAGEKQTVTDASLTDFYSLVLYKTEYVFVQVTAPSGLAESISVRSGRPPTSTQYDDKVSRPEFGSGTSFAFSLCAQQGEATAFLGVSHDSNTGTGKQYTLETSTYNSLIQLNTTTTGSMPGAGTKYYYTTVVSTFDYPKRIVAVSDDESETIALSYSTQATDCGKIESADEYNWGACVDVPDKKGTTYVNLMTSEAVDYTITQEKGTCHEWELANDAASVTVTFALSAVFLFVALTF